MINLRGNVIADVSVGYSLSQDNNEYEDYSKNIIKMYKAFTWVAEGALGLEGNEVLA